MLYKNTPHFTKDINGRSVTGIFAVHGNMDNGNDISINGSFAKRLTDGSRKRARFLWNHDSWQPPIASIKAIREIGRDELPEKVLAFAPDATGGVEVTREYYEGVDLANWVLAGIKAGDIDEMSYAYDLHEFATEERDGKQVRIFKDVEIFDISDVNWGMNPATAGVKSRLGAKMSFMGHSDWVVNALDEYADRVQARKDFREKAGRVLSQQNRDRISSLIKSLNDVAGDLNQLLIDADPKSENFVDPELVYGALAEFERLKLATSNL